jgi:hypothetical protein
MSRKPKFKTGDRVRHKYGCIMAGIELGAIGTVLEESTCPFIRWDIAPRYGHGCLGLCDKPFGWAEHDDRIELIP